MQHALQAPRSSGLDAILIADLPLESTIGVAPLERQAPQIVLLDIQLYCDLRTAGRTDRLADTLDYAQLAEDLQSWTRGVQPALLESLAAHLCAHLFVRYPICQAVSLWLRKPAAVPPAMAGIAVFRERPMCDPLESLYRISS